MNVRHYRILKQVYFWVVYGAIFVYASPSVAQQVVPDYPKNYFRNPMGVPMELSANFGELRPNHWHMGLDIRTQQRENLPVYAAAQGYIAKVGIRSQSFGRFIVINHPNGLSTLYGHLNDFNPELEAWVTAQQYEQESWAVELDIPQEKFPVSKGSFIAYSGNTGGSQGPHLHFEIMDTRSEKRLNPLLFGFPIADNVPPSLVKLAMYDRSRSVYDQSPRFFPLKNTDSGYIIPKLPVIRTGLSKVSFALQMFDRLSGSNNPNGVCAATLFLNDQPQAGFFLDSVDYEETGYMNAHVDYRLKYNGGGWVQHISLMPGEHGAVYKPINGDGVIALSDTSVHAVRIEVKDANGNRTELNFQLQYDDSLAATLKRPVDIPHFAPNREDLFEQPDFKIRLASKSIFDSVRIYYSRSNYSIPATAVTPLHQVNDADVPVQAPFTVLLKPFREIRSDLREKVLIQRTYRSGRTVRKASWDQDWLKAEFDDFGYFQAFIDTIPPDLDELGRGDTINLSGASRIVFSPTDNFGVIRRFRAELNGQWLRFTNDKSRNWIYSFDERCPFGTHELRVTAEDLAGNRVTKSWWFKRGPYTPPPKKKAVKKKTTKQKKAPVKKKTTAKKTTAVKKKR